ncbi:MAG: hypothetical protein WBV94_31920 [Blastocatellia bacterium]
MRCSCARRYLVFTGAGAVIGDAPGRVRERAGQMQARFIDAREIPFMNCECGELLDFTADDTALVVM